MAQQCEISANASGFGSFRNRGTKLSYARPSRLALIAFVPFFVLGFFLAEELVEKLAVAAMLGCTAGIVAFAITHYCNLRMRVYRVFTSTRRFFSRENPILQRIAKPLRSMPVPGLKRQRQQPSLPAPQGQNLKTIGATGVIGGVGYYLTCLISPIIVIPATLLGIYGARKRIQSAGKTRMLGHAQAPQLEHTNAPVLEASRDEGDPIRLSQAGTKPKKGPVRRKKKSNRPLVIRLAKGVLVVGVGTSLTCVAPPVLLLSAAFVVGASD